MFKINWASLIVGSKFIIFVLFYFVLILWAAFPSMSPQEAYIWRGDLTEGLLQYEFGRLIHWVEGLIFGILRYYTMDLFLFRYYKTKVQACIQPLH